MRIEQVKSDYFIVIVFLIIGTIAFTGTAWSKGTLPPPANEYCVKNGLTKQLVFPSMASYYQGNKIDFSLKMEVLVGLISVSEEIVLPGQKKCIDISGRNVNYLNVYYKTARGAWRKFTDNRAQWQGYLNWCDYHINAMNIDSRITDTNCVDIKVPYF